MNVTGLQPTTSSLHFVLAMFAVYKHKATETNLNFPLWSGLSPPLVLYVDKDVSKEPSLVGRSENITVYLLLHSKWFNSEDGGNVLLRNLGIGLQD